MYVKTMETTLSVIWICCWLDHQKEFFICFVQHLTTCVQKIVMKFSMLESIFWRSEAKAIQQNLLSKIDKRYIVYIFSTTSTFELSSFSKCETSKQKKKPNLLYSNTKVFNTQQAIQRIETSFYATKIPFKVLRVVLPKWSKII